MRSSIEAHRQYQREWARAWRLRNRTQLAQKQREWRVKNPGKAAEYKRLWDQRNPEKRRSIDKATLSKKRAYIRAQKDQPCVDCGQRFHFCVMDFDHIGTDKKFSIGQLKAGFQQIVDEIKKCEVVCSNCHRIRTYRRRFGGDSTLIQ